MDVSPGPCSHLARPIHTSFSHLFPQDVRGREPWCLFTPSTSYSHLVFTPVSSGCVHGREPWCLFTPSTSYSHLVFTPVSSGCPLTWALVPVPT